MGFRVVCLDFGNRKSTGQERRSMDTGSKSGKGFTDEDEDDEVVGRREASSQKGWFLSFLFFELLLLIDYLPGVITLQFWTDLTVKIDRKTHQNNNDQEATTPRSKHSATEQRRRSKINDRQVFYLTFIILCLDPLLSQSFNHNWLFVF